MRKWRGENEMIWKDEVFPDGREEACVFFGKMMIMGRLPKNRTPISMEWETNFFLPTNYSNTSKWYCYQIKFLVLCSFSTI